MIFSLFCLLLCALRVDFGSAVSADDMKNHLATTFANYDTRIRPVYSDQSKAVDVTMDMYLIGINNFDSIAQKLTTTGYLDIGKKTLT